MFRLSRQRGWFEGLIHGRWHGWAVASAFPKRAAVILLADNGRWAEAVADEYRADLVTAGFGDGCYGFSVPQARLPGAAKVRAIFAETGGEIPKLGKANHTALAEVKIGSLHCRVDRMAKEATVMTGYVYDVIDPTRRCELALIGKGRVLDKIHATLFREDLRTVAGAGDGLHGFRLRLGATRASLSLVETMGHVTLLTLKV